MPDHFFIVGAQRTGTTYLYTLLDEHPDIDMAKPARPEPKFFLDETRVAKGPDAYIEQYFDTTANPKCRGEKSTTYIEREDAAMRIAQLFPDARILMVLRDPIERAISNYAFSRANDFEDLEMWEAFTSEEARITQFDGAVVSASPFAYLRRGRYIDCIRIYEKHFKRDHLHIVLHEDLVDGGNGIARVYDFLGVDTTFTPPSLGKTINPNPQKAGELTKEQYEVLAKEFAPYSQALAKHTGLDLSPWPSLR